MGEEASAGAPRRDRAEDFLDDLEGIDLSDPRAVAKRTGGRQTRRLVEAVRRALYDAEISYCDFEIGRLFDRLREMGIYDDALIVLMADHGENPIGWTSRFRTGAIPA